MATDDDDKIGIMESVSIALGGMIGGGIFAVLGVIAQITFSATWFAFFLAGIVALSAAYSYNALNRLTKGTGGSVTFVQTFLNNSTLAGVTGWTLLFGYIGSMAMYAYAFGSFFVGLVGIDNLHFLAFSARQVISVLAIFLFAGLNILGARSTGITEDILVGVKIAILLLFGLWGLFYGSAQNELEFGISKLIGSGPIVAAAVSFVAFQGWQLLFYDQESIKSPVRTITKAVYVAIPAAVAIYIIVAMTTVSMAPLSAITSQPERALAIAAKPFMGHFGFTLISLAALFSTGSAINATLFSSSYFAKNMLSKGLLPDRIGDSSKSGLPGRAVIVIALITAIFTWFGGLDSITSFSSIAFIVVFGGMSYLAFEEKRKREMSRIFPMIGILGSIVFLPLMFWFLYTQERGIFISVLILATSIVLVELFYFERELLVEDIREAEAKIEKEFNIIKRDGSKEAFDRNKLEGSCKKAGAPEGVVRRIAATIERELEEEATTSEIRDLALAKLKSLKSHWVKNWLDHERKKGSND